MCLKMRGQKRSLFDLQAYSAIFSDNRYRYIVVDNGTVIENYRIGLLVTKCVGNIL